ncbi:MAG: DUF2027 domain-containing protein [Bacteroidales bacterium]|nr:DUF2027 domain-containing protein [Bacteroidales bacterium]
MKIKVGDTVKFLNDTGSGTVTGIMDQKTALVQIEGGFEVPWLISDLVIESGSYMDGNDDEKVTSEGDAAQATFGASLETMPEQELVEDEEIILALVPDDNTSAFSAYLVNSSSYRFFFTIARQQEGELILFKEWVLDPGMKINLGAYQPQGIDTEDYFRVQGIFFNNGFYRHMAPLDLLLKILARDLYDATRRKENDYFHEKAILYKLYDWNKPKESPEIEIDADKLKQAMLSKGDIKEKQPDRKKQVQEEIDLHIQELTDDYADLSNSEILGIQLARFRTALESAILHKSNRIVFIHGIGNGKLKHEIRRIIDHEYKKVHYQDASFKEYGYGATMAIIKR